MMHIKGLCKHINNYEAKKLHNKSRTPVTQTLKGNGKQFELAGNSSYRKEIQFELAGNLSYRKEIQFELAGNLSYRKEIQFELVGNLSYRKEIQFELAGNSRFYCILPYSFHCSRSLKSEIKVAIETGFPCIPSI